MHNQVRKHAGHLKSSTKPANIAACSGALSKMELTSLQDGSWHSYRYRSLLGHSTFLSLHSCLWRALHVARMNLKQSVEPLDCAMGVKWDWLGYTTSTVRDICTFAVLGWVTRCFCQLYSGRVGHSDVLGTLVPKSLVFWVSPLRKLVLLGSLG